MRIHYFDKSEKGRIMKTFYVSTHPTNSRRNQKTIHSLRRFVEVIVLHSWPSDQKPIDLSPRSFLKLLTLAVKATSSRSVTIVDLYCALPLPYLLKKNLVLSVSEPVSEEIKFLGHRTLGAIMSGLERKLIKKAALVLAPNRHMERYCIERGAKRVQILPNYPPKSFRPSVDKEVFKRENGLPSEAKVVLFSAAVRLREIYGLDLLLDSWKILEKKRDDIFLVILGPRPDGDKSYTWTVNYVQRHMSANSINRIVLPGWQNYENYANWLSTADVCVATRTPNFPSNWFDDKDSTKISEYAALRKPIVANGYAPSKQYLLVDGTPEALAEGVLSALEGKVRPAEPHFWEENEEKLFKAIEAVI